MDLSNSSSEDECDLYINAAHKLNALKRRTERKKKHSDNDDDIDDNCTDDVKKDSINLSSFRNNDEIDAKSTSVIVIDSDYKAVHSKTELETIIVLDDDSDVITCLDDNNESGVVHDTRITRRSTRSSKKRMNAIPPSLEAPFILNDSIERELSDSLNQSFNSQEENDNYVVIGSPPPCKKSNTDDYEVSVKVLWKSNKVERFGIKKNETFQKIFRHFANIEGVHEDQILITKKEKRITPYDTPISINWSIIDILDGGVVSAEIMKKNKTNSSKSKIQDNICQIKIQTSDKRTLSISLNKDEPFSNLLKKCSDELKIPETKIKLYFDGDLLDELETPESLDLEDEACVDLKIIK